VVNPVTGEYSHTNSLSGSTAITATYDTSKDGLVTIGKENENNVFLSVAPVTIAKNATVTVTIETETAAGADGHTIVKTFKPTADIAFESSKPTVLKLTLTDDNVEESVTISKITAAGTYSVTGATVMAVYNQNLIVSDATGSILVFASSSSHGYKVGDVLDINGTVKVYNQIFEFDKPTLSKTGTATVTYPAAVEYDTEKITAYATASVIEYGHALGTASSSARTVTLADGTVLNIYGDLSSVDGRVVDIYGYAFGYYASKSLVNFLYTSATVDESYSYLATNPKSGETITWNADESGTTSAQTITITVNSKATGYKVSDESADWSVTNNGDGTLTVYPKAANTSTTAEKTLDVTVTHLDNTALTSTVHLVQKVSGASSEKTVTFTAASDKGDGTVTKDNVTISMSTMSNGANYRCNKNTDMTVSVPNGKKITKIIVTCTANGTAQYGPGNFSTETGTYTASTAKTGTWTGESQTVTLTASKAQARMTSIEVTYK
jgi:hypothetical protein